MNKNMGGTDRIIRLIIALGLVILFFTDVIPGALGYLLVIIAAIFIFTSFVSFCPIYSIFGLSSCPQKSTHIE